MLIGSGASVSPCLFAARHTTDETVTNTNTRRHQTKHHYKPASEVVAADLIYNGNQMRITRKIIEHCITTSIAFTNNNNMCSKPSLRGVIFDMDGTLTMPNLDFAEMYRRCGVSRTQDILEVVSFMDPSEAGRCNAIIEEMEEEGRRNLKLSHGALEFGRWLSSHSVPMAIVTRNKKRTVDSFVRSLWLENGRASSSGVNNFSPIIARDSPVDVPFKPDSTAAELIAKQWSVDLPTSDLVMVGDSPANDVLFGKNAGIATALLDTHGRCTADGSGSSPPVEADYVIEYLWQLPRMLFSNFNIDGPFGTGMPLKKYPAPEATNSAAVASITGDLQTLSSLSKEEITSIDDSGNTLLIWASDAGQTKAVELIMSKLLEHECVDAHINVRGYLGATALCRASRRGHIQILEVLLQQGEADPDIANDKLQYPLHFAAFKKHHNAVSTLLKYGANTLVLDRKGRTPAEDTSDEQIRETIVRRRETQLKQFTADVPP